VRQALEEELAAGDDAAVDAVIRDLVATKTRHAELTEERDRRKLERKKLEDKLARLKFDVASLMAADDQRDEHHDATVLPTSSTAGGPLFSSMTRRDRARS